MSNIKLFLRKLPLYKTWIDLEL